MRRAGRIRQDFYWKLVEASVLYIYNTAYILELSRHAQIRIKSLELLLGFFPKMKNKAFELVSILLNLS